MPFTTFRLTYSLFHLFILHRYRLRFVLFFLPETLQSLILSVTSFSPLCFCVSLHVSFSSISYLLFLRLRAFFLLFFIWMASFTSSCCDDTIGLAIDSSHKPDFLDWPSYLVVQCIKCNNNCLGGCGYAVMRFAGSIKEIPDIRTGRMGDTAAGAWAKRWLHCRNWGATASSMSFTR